MDDPDNGSEWLKRLAQHYPAKVLSVDGDPRPAAEVWQRVCSLAKGFRSMCLQSGHRIMFISSTTADLLEAFLAAWQCNAVIVPLNTRWTQKEYQYAFDLTQPTLIVYSPQFRHLVSNDTAQAGKVLLPGKHTIEDSSSTEDLIRTHSSEHTAEEATNVKKNTDDVAAIIFTSGTTGQAKGVALTFSALSFQADAKIKGHGYSFEDVYLHTAPVYHVGGLVSFLAMLKVGACQIILPKFSPSSFVESALKYRVSAFIAVPTMIIDLLRTKVVMPDVKKILLGGGELQASYLQKLPRLFPEARIWIAWGMTECASSITACEIQPRNPPSASNLGVLVGKPPSGIKVAVLLHGTIVETSSGLTGVEGQLVTKGPQVMRAYWRAPEATQQAMHGEWFCTGDLGCVDGSGNVYLKGRLKDVIRTGSENVSAPEVERILLRMPGVKAAAVVGLPHERLGEQVTAVLQVPHTDADLAPSVNELQAFCQQKGLARIKTPQLVFCQTEDLPANSSGKLLKSAIREQAMMKLQKHSAQAHSKL